MTSAAEFSCTKGDITISIDQMCDGNNDCPGPDEYSFACLDKKKDEYNNTNEFASEYPENVTDTPVTNEKKK